MQPWKISQDLGIFSWGSKRELFSNKEIPNQLYIWESFLLSNVVKQDLNIKKYVISQEKSVIYGSYLTIDSLLIIIDISCIYILSFLSSLFFLPIFHIAHLSIREVILIRRTLFFLRFNKIGHDGKRKLTSSDIKFHFYSVYIYSNVFINYFE